MLPAATAEEPELIADTKSSIFPQPPATIRGKVINLEIFFINFKSKPFIIPSLVTSFRIISPQPQSIARFNTFSIVTFSFFCDECETGIKLDPFFFIR